MLDGRGPSNISCHCCRRLLMWCCLTAFDIPDYDQRFWVCLYRKRRWYVVVSQTFYGVIGITKYHYGSSSFSSDWLDIKRYEGPITTSVGYFWVALFSDIRKSGLTNTRKMKMDCKFLTCLGLHHAYSFSAISQRSTDHLPRSLVVMTVVLVIFRLRG